MWSLQLNKIYISSLASLLACFSLSAYSYQHAEYTENHSPYSGASAPAGDFETRARVIRAEPVYETVTVYSPVTECWIEQRAAYASQPDRRVAAGVIGGILGGVAGHQVGRGRVCNLMRKMGRMAVLQKPLKCEPHQEYKIYP